MVSKNEAKTEMKHIAAIKCFSCGKIGHKKVDCRSRSKSESTDKKKQEDSSRKKKTCSTCEKIGHTSEQCWKNKTCDKCGTKGHTAEVCRKKSINAVQNKKAVLNQMNGWLNEK